ncbi:matrix-remodeling-associated protein 7-like [Patiria miniata]|uniref:Matrix-remodeling-associated protein 7 helical domain-containing protein n=1 Tax=Patiria miniata TaxID=46514 RepID=A0A914AKI8_PATMI|nr:matrix-remodeling-associated protein 7-like [Patiria miniata]
MTILVASSQEALLYITAGLCTFLAIIVSYRWLLRKPVKASEEGKGDIKKESTEQEDTEETAEKDKPKAPAVCPFGFGAPPSTDETQEPQPHGSLDDLLIDSSDIQPLSEEEKRKLQDDGAGSVESEEGQEMLDHRRVKELEEEVVKSMSEQQLEDERKARQAQLEAIFNLMQDNSERFGMSSVDDVQNQYKLYV